MKWSKLVSLLKNLFGLLEQDKHDEFRLSICIRVPLLALDSKLYNKMTTYLADKARLSIPANQNDRPVY